MSFISETYQQYSDALKESQGRYEDLYQERSRNAIEFYESFLKDLIVRYAAQFSDPAGKRRIKYQIEEFFGKDVVTFTAIDGSCYKDLMEDFMIFFGGSYGVKGQISFRGDPPDVRYERWSMDKDVSMVAYVPIPFAEIGDLTGGEMSDELLASDTEKINLTSIHTQIMQLAEVYLAYDVVSSAMFYPNLVLMDYSLSSILNSTDIGVDEITLVGYEYRGRNLQKQDVRIAYSHPYNKPLQVPSPKKFRRYNYVLSELYGSKAKSALLSDLAAKIGVSERELQGDCNILQKQGEEIIDLDSSNGRLSLKPQFFNSWEFCVGLFEDICYRLFKEKQPEALLYETFPEGERKLRWMSPNDLKFLIAVGLRALVEQCWQKKIMLLGIAKDSASQYFTRNYLGVLHHLGIYDFQPVRLPWFDRICLEVIPMGDDDLKAPWSTVEFDSTFMTLHLDPATNEVTGVKGKVVSTERLFGRCLAQFFLTRRKRTPLAGHVIFVDRLFHPLLDPKKWGNVGIPKEASPEMGQVFPLVFLSNADANKGQEMSIYLLDTLTRNLYPEVIGYPDPLNKADWGAKTLQRKVKAIIQGSEVSFRSRPLTKTLRQIRDERGR